MLGHRVSKKGTEVDKAKIDMISNFPVPTSVKQVRSFLCYAGFYRRFIKEFSNIAHPLTNLLSKANHFLNEQLFFCTPIPWFAHIMNYLAPRKIPPH